MKIPGIIISMLDNLFQNRINEICSKYLQDYGSLTSHSIRYEKELAVELKFDLYGEKELIEINLWDISVSRFEDEYYLKIGRINTQREWMRKLGQDYLDGRFNDPRIKINYQLGQMLSKFIK